MQCENDIMTDQKVFESSLEDFADRIRNVLSGSNNIVVALSRKGPRLLESLFRQDALYGKVISEHALPFLFLRLSKNSTMKCNIHIADDAIYYGSTVKSLIEEIEGYIRVLKLDNRVKLKSVIAVIKDPSSMDVTVDGLAPLANDSVRGGYGHYFVKQVMRKIRGNGSPLEIEFPVVCYRLVKKTTLEQVYQALVQTNRTEIVGLVNKNDGIESVSLVLTEPDDTTFYKFRIYIKGCDLKISVIAPELVPADFGQLRYAAFGNVNSWLTHLWKNLYDKLHNIFDVMGHNGGSTRNIERSAVILLNFLSSIDTYCYMKWKVEKSLSDFIGEEPFMWLDNVNVGYLTDYELCDSVVSEIQMFLNSEECSTLPIRWRMDTSKDVVRETLSMTDSEKESLIKANMSGVYQSESVEEALSVMMFNQMVMVEKMSRFDAMADYHSRLRFGYSYYSIMDFIRRHSSVIGSVDVNGARLHEWIDSQIDNGCIVPQYVIDMNNNCWTRVFRPGENEDVMLSHLGRFVAFVMDNMFRYDKDREIGKVQKDNLNGVLTFVYHKCQDSIKAQEPTFDFKVHEKHFLYKSNNKESIVDFLVRMSVLTIEENNIISLNSRLQRKEFSEYTTLDDSLNNLVKDSVKLIVNRLVENKFQAEYLYPNTINYFLLDYSDEKVMKYSIDKVGNLIIDKVRVILSAIENDSYDEMLAQNNIKYIVDSYKECLSQYELKNEDVLSERIWRHSLGDEVRKVRRLLFAINMLIIIVFKHIHIKEYVKMERVVGIKEVLKCDEVINATEKSINGFTPDTNLLNSIIDYIKLNVLS